MHKLIIEAPECRITGGAFSWLLGISQMVVERKDLSPKSFLIYANNTRSRFAYLPLSAILLMIKQNPFIYIMLPTGHCKEWSFSPLTIRIKSCYNVYNAFKDLFQPVFEKKDRKTHLI